MFPVYGRRQEAGYPVYFALIVDKMAPLYFFGSKFQKSET